MTAKIVALYLRLSPRPDDDYAGLDVQERLGRDYAAKTWPGVPVEVFKDEGMSATNGDRPAYKALRDAVRDGRVAHVWTVEQSRLERDEARWFALVAELVAGGVAEVHTHRDGILRVRDVAASIRAVVSADERRRMIERVNDRLAANAANGDAPAVTPYGYERPKGTKTLVVVPDEAEVIRWAADRVMAGWSLTAIATDLDRRGVRGRHGGRINATSVRAWLTAPTMAGKRVHRGQVVGAGTWEPIIDEATFRQVGAMLAKPRTVRNTAGRAQGVTAGHLAHRVGRRYALTSGLSVCGVCGAPLSGSTVKAEGNRPFLRCKAGHVRVDYRAAEDHVLGLLWAELDRPGFLDPLGADDHEARRAELVDALGVVDARRRELAAEWADGGLTVAEWRAAREALDGREDDLRTRLADIPPAADPVDIDTARAAWPAMTLDERRQFLRLFVERVTVGPATRLGPVGFDPDRITVTWRTVR